MNSFGKCPRSWLIVGLLLLAHIHPGHAAGNSDLVWFRVDANHLADSAPWQAARILDYGTFQWMGVGSEETEGLEGLGLQRATFQLELGGRRFDPGQGDPVVDRDWQNQVRNLGPDLHLIQFVGPTRREWLEHVHARDLAIVQYIHPYTYVVWGMAPDLMGELSSVRWSGPFEPAYKVLPTYRSLGGSVLQWSGLLYRGADVARTVAALEAAGGRDIRTAPMDEVFLQVKLLLSGAAIAQAAAIPGVYTLKPQPLDGGLRGEMSNQICVNNYDGMNQAFPGYSSWLSSTGLDGSGVIMANVDGGIYHNHPDLESRMLPCAGSTCGGPATDFHGTHTAAIMAADGSSGVTDGYGFLRGQGVAPGSNLVEQIYFSYPDANGLLNLIHESYANGAVLSSNSWGPSGSPLGYDDDTRQVDVGVRDADPLVVGNQELTYVLSIMNGYGGISSQGTPDEAKNIFTIGSTKMQSGGGAQILDIFDLSSNSAHGPALDGRSIPHLVAPGCSVDSAISATGHGMMCGTSMSSPHVSGGVALFMERYRRLFGRTPSPALVKAAFLPVAHDLAGYRDADGGTLGHAPDSKQGWGRMDLDAVVDPDQTVTYRDQMDLLSASGQEWSANWLVLDPTKPVRMMLVWTDAPGHGLGLATPAWNNDLDLFVEAGGAIFKGNQFDSAGWSLANSPNSDERNNTEGVFLAAGAATSLTITVLAANITSDGVPGRGTSTDQDFALVCYNCGPEELFSDGFESGNTSAWGPPGP